jgi:hypothetical protein
MVRSRTIGSRFWLMWLKETDMDPSDAELKVPDVDARLSAEKAVAPNARSLIVAD